MEPSEPPRRKSYRETGIMMLLFIFLLVFVYTLIPEPPLDRITNFCPQQSPLPVKGNYEPSRRFYSPEYSNFSLRALQGAIQVPSMSFDDMEFDPSKDARFEVFMDLHNYLHRTFPLAAKHSELVNHYGLLYTFKGSNPSLKPVVLMAHQDVVPVPEDTVDEWTYPPFEGHYDGEFIHGRGSSDTKDTLVGVLESIESLLQQGWSPKRTLVVSFGFDEEIGGFRGAHSLAETIEDRYGEDGIELIVDEGFGMPVLHGTLVGNVLVGEKGYIDIDVSLQTPGGHSSNPPDHTSIGILSELVRRLEASPFHPELNNNNPTLGLYRCLAEHAPTMDKELRRTVLDIDHGGNRDELTRYISSIPEQRYLIRTSQAVDVIEGGVKLNALPERVEVKVNHRINPNSGTVAIIDRLEDFVTDLARDFKMGLVSQGKIVLDSTSNGVFNVTVSRPLEPAPLSPHYGIQWDLISGTTQSIMQELPPEFKITEPLVVAPGLFPANTDTRHYWNLTRAIYRFTPALASDMINYHTVNERLRFRSHLMVVAWYYEFILNSTL